MKKDKEKHRHVPESTTADEPKVSSVTLTLQLLTKEKEKNKEAEKKNLLMKQQKYAVRFVLKKSHLNVFVLDMVAAVVETKEALK
ncbi:MULTISPECIES: hypothetical protein [Legionella]|uniref:Uncharacterized protein n=1 Tax=Legionella fallonii LLAP-10 TaxID=1212491 RepID=A0A098G748_9GAMM|nr:conserved protein of unknown function [Legionella fallonii LLAP-10]